MNIKLLGRTVALRVLAGIACLLIYGCGGGISGTGDGGVVATIETDTGSTDGTTTNFPNDVRPEDTQIYNLQTLPTRLSFSIAEAFINPATSPRNSLPVPANLAAVDTALQVPLQSLALEIIAIQVDLVLIEHTISSALVSCSGTATCGNLPTNITSEFTSEVADFEASITTTGVGGSRTRGTLVEFRDILYQPETSGFFDERFTYTRDDGTQVVLQWTDGEGTVSLFSESDNATVYALLQHDQSPRRMVVRRTDNTSPGVLQAVLLSDLPGDNADQHSTTFIEADLHTPFSQHYIRGFADGTFTTLFSQHPTDLNQPVYRQTSSAADTTLTIDACILRTENLINCLEWQTGFSNAPLASSQPALQFEAFENRFGDFASTATDNPGSAPAAPGVSEFVAATNASGVSPAAEALACGGQRLHGLERNFCWQPLPLPEPVTIFEEIIQTDSIRYLRLP